MTCPCPHDMAATDTCCCTEDCKNQCVPPAPPLPTGSRQGHVRVTTDSTETPIYTSNSEAVQGKVIPPDTILKSVTVFQYVNGDPSLVVAEEMMDGTVWAYATTKSGNQRVLNYQNMKTLLDTMPATWSKMYHREVREEFQPRS